MEDKVYKDSQIGDITLRKSVRARRISIRVHPVGGVVITVPYYLPYKTGLAFFSDRRDWVISTLDRQKKNSVETVRLTSGQIEELRCRAKAFLPGRLDFLAKKYGFVYNKVTIKHNRTNWGSCSTKGNINLNLSLMRLPFPLSDYVILHELCHLRHPNHGEEFHDLLEKLCADDMADIRAALVTVPEKQAPQTYECLQNLFQNVSESRASRPFIRALEKEIRRFSTVL